MYKAGSRAPRSPGRVPQAGSCGNLGFSRRKRGKASLKTSFFSPLTDLKANKLQISNRLSCIYKQVFLITRGGYAFLRLRRKSFAEQTAAPPFSPFVSAFGSKSRLVQKRGWIYFYNSTVFVPCQIVLGIWASGIWWDLGGSGGTGSCVKLVGQVGVAQRNRFVASRLCRVRRFFKITPKRNRILV